MFHSDRVSKSADSRERPCFPSEPELASNGEEDKGVLRNMNDQETLSYPFRLMLLLSVSQSLVPKMMTLKERGKIGQPLVLFYFYFSPSLLISKLKVESVGGLCMYQEVK